MLGPVIDVLDALEHLAVVSTTVATELAEAEQAEWACDLEPPSIRPSPTGAPSPSTSWPRPPRSCGPSSDDRERLQSQGLSAWSTTDHWRTRGAMSRPQATGDTGLSACRLERFHSRLADTPGSAHARRIPPKCPSTGPRLSGSRPRSGTCRACDPEGQALAAGGPPCARPALALSRTASRQDDAVLHTP